MPCRSALTPTCVQSVSRLNLAALPPELRTKSMDCGPWTKDYGPRTMDYQTYEHDVIVIGAGGAGLRAAIEASAAGVSVGLVCKSLLGKAHTVMAEGGIAAALANVDERDNWKVHFADTMRGGQ